MKAVVSAFNQEKALVGAFSVITNLRMELFEALVGRPPGPQMSAGGAKLCLVFEYISTCTTPGHTQPLELLNFHLIPSRVDAVVMDR